MIKEEFKTWLNNQYRYSDKTKKTYLQQLKHLDLNNLESNLLKLRSTKSDKTFNLIIVALRAFSRFLRQEYPKNNLISKIDQLESIRSPRAEPHKPYNQEEVRKILNAAKGWRRVALHIALYAGLRQQEIQSLDLQDIDLENGIITVRSGKGGKRREVAISNILKAELERWIQLRNLQDSNSESLLISNRGSRPNLQSGSVLQILSQNVGFKVSWHRCRSTYATMLYKKSKDVKLVQFQLGHSNSSTTDRYIQRSLSVIKEQINQIGDIYERKQ